MNLITIIQTIQKLKAGLQILLEQKEDKMLPKIKQLYFDEATLLLNEKDRAAYTDSLKTSYCLKFLGRDERLNFIKDKMSNILQQSLF